MHLILSAIGLPTIASQCFNLRVLSLSLDLSGNTKAQMERAFGALLALPLREVWPIVASARALALDVVRKLLETSAV